MSCKRRCHHDVVDVLGCRIFGYRRGLHWSTGSASLPRQRLQVQEAGCRQRQLHAVPSDRFEALHAVDRMSERRRDVEIVASKTGRSARAGSYGREWCVPARRSQQRAAALKRAAPSASAMASSVRQ